MADRLESRQIKMAKGQWDFLKQLGRDLSYGDGRGDHSKLVREIVSAAATKWRESPYVCVSAKYTILITRDGHIFYRQVHELNLNKKRERLPCGIGIKPEKKRVYLKSCPRGQDEASWFKSLWLINYFAAYHGKHCSQDNLLDSFIDHDGADGKFADLLIDQGPDSHIVREAVLGLKEFVLWRGERRGDDRVGIPIDIPMRNLEMVVVIDTDLYRKSPLEKEEIPKLALEFRNPESARFEGDAVSRDPWNPMEDALVGRYFEGDAEDDVREVKDRLKELELRLRALEELEAVNGTVVPKERRQEFRKSLKIPASFLYYRLKWPSPYFGLEACVRWERPVKVR